MPNISRNERKFEFNISTSGALGCAISDQRVPVMQAAQRATDLHGWTDPMQDAWAEVWTSPVVPKSDSNLAEVIRPPLESYCSLETHTTSSSLPYRTGFTHLQAIATEAYRTMRFRTLASHDIEHKL